LLSVTIWRMASGQGPSWLLIITRGSRWWASVRLYARCVGRYPWEWPSYAASGHQRSGHHHQWESVRRIPRRHPGRPHGSLRRAQPASDIEVPSHEFRYLPSQLPAGLITAAVPPISLRRGFQPAFPIAPLISVKSRSPQIQSRRGLHRKAGSPCLTRAFELGHRPVSDLSSRRHHAIGRSPFSAPPGRCRSTLSLGPSRRRSCESAWRQCFGAFVVCIKPFASRKPARALSRCTAGAKRSRCHRAASCRQAYGRRNWGQWPCYATSGPSMPPVIITNGGRYPGLHPVNGIPRPHWFSGFRRHRS